MNLCALPRCPTGEYAASDSLLCEPCIEHLVGTLRDVEENVAALTPVKGRRPEMVNTSAGYESASPAADHALVILDPRSRVNGHRTEWGAGRVDRPDDDPDPPLSIAVLGEWAKLTGPYSGTVRDAVSTLLINHRWITEQDWVVDYADELYRLLGQLLRANGDAPNKVQATCTRKFWTKDDRGKRVAMLCGGGIVEVDGGAKCLACRQPYAGFQLIRLGMSTKEAG